MQPPIQPFETATPGPQKGFRPGAVNPPGVDTGAPGRPSTEPILNPLLPFGTEGWKLTPWWEQLLGTDQTSRG